MGRLLAIVLLTGCSFDKALEQTAVDASAGDAAVVAFDPARCPDNFTAIGSLPHRYRWSFVYDANADTWEDGRARCATLVRDGGYRAHLVVFETVAERDAVLATYGPDMNWRWFWTGVFRNGTSAGWTTIFNTPHMPAFADGSISGNSPEPERGLAVGMNANGTTLGDLDIDRDWGQLSLCECDGREGTTQP